MGKIKRQVGTARHHRRGTANGSKRGTPDVQNARKRRREQDPRVAAARAEVEEAEQLLRRKEAQAQREAEWRAKEDARLQGIFADPAPMDPGDVPEAVLEPVPAVVEPIRAEPPAPHQRDMRGKGAWTLGQARSMLREGYQLAHVTRLTGWGAYWLEDLPVDTDGYGVRESA